MRLYEITGKLFIVHLAWQFMRLGPPTWPPQPTAPKSPQSPWGKSIGRHYFYRGFFLSLPCPGDYSYSTGVFSFSHPEAQNLFCYSCYDSVLEIHEPPFATPATLS